MIVGIGNDLVEIQRLTNMLNKGHGQRFLERCFTQQEQQLCNGRSTPQRACCYAKRFAAKEAVIKALGVGFRQGLWFTDIEVLPNQLGRPTVTLHGATAQWLACHHPGQVNIHLSLSDEKGLAIATALIECHPLAMAPS
ncbi:holo-acyl-carrier-protein synthase [Magnetococcus marinus MC-1]|uniref:Holo-[acyl-carrier-protein] synthase n=1 Tax=Magnetococcus marinus (strain ATCC BAA-1437 / JCM 17883 / MC-1) TaxID=156889 RepID=ACPS_MAGMM|nr:holo-ACP synthase [Magnetococcus marinus]A0L8S4.1 RecName: Full=Holo-[acyl-carrier-protein] synthase; Short=Holo-ACP synthase; AltName: Full=4'-phosphopantetheinyl transferase AcpS [Magnetococcus marinus MC-1]ABK44367.1 holo-acyl-carrier-protein synthase [Magnetococcus marinus MC-1]